MAPTDLPVTRVLLSQLGHDLMILAEAPDQADSRCGRRWLPWGKAGRFVADKPMAASGTWLRCKWRRASSVGGGKAAVPRGCGIFSP